MGLRSFFGFLPPRLAYTRQASDFEALPLPDQVTLLLRGVPPDALAIAVGAAVRTGQNLAPAGAEAVVATVTGRVSRLTSVTDADGCPATAVVIETSGEDDHAELGAPIVDWEDAEPSALRQALLQTGLPGLDALRIGARVATVIASGLDEAPGCSTVRAQLGVGAETIADGLRLLQRATGADQVVLAWPADGAALAGLPREIRCERVPPFYPHGLPELLAVRCGGWLLQCTPGGVFGDTLVLDLATLAAAVACVRSGGSQVDTTVSCLGPNGQPPRNLRVRIGAPAAQLLAHLGLQPQAGGKLILGSPLRGAAAADPTAPIRPHTRQLILQAPNQVHRFQRTACTNCGKCNQVCPVGLEVNLLGRYTEYDRYDRCADLAVERCVDCGLCAYVCPAHRPLAQLMAHAKQTLWRSPDKRQAAPEAPGCNACGPTCPAVRLFDLGAEPVASGEKERS